MNVKKASRMRRLFRILSFSTFLMIVLLSCNLENLGGEIVIKNESVYSLVEFYVTLQDSENWGENLLDSTVEPGESTTISGLPREDIKVKSVFQDGDLFFENINETPDLSLYSKITLELNI